MFSPWWPFEVAAGYLVFWGQVCEALTPKPVKWEWA